MIGYAIVGPIIALLLSLKFTDKRYKDQQAEYKELVAKVELLQTRNDAVDKEMLQKIMTTVMPIAKAVNKLNTEVGIR